FGPEAGIRIKELHSQLSSTQGVDALEKIGVSAMNADGKLRELPEIVRDLASATESMDPAAKLAAFDSIAGAGQGEQLAQLIEGMNLNGIGSIIEAMQGSQGELARLASEKRDTLGVDLLIFQQSLDGISIALNDIAKGPMQYVVQGMTVLTHAVTDFIQNNQILVGIIMFVIAAFAGIMVISGAALVAIGNLILGYAAMRFAFLKVAAAAQWLFPVLINGLRTVASVLIANPIGLAIAAIAVVVAVVAWLIYDNWEWIKNVLSWSPLEMLAAAWNGIMDFLGLENLKTDVEGIWEAIKTILSWSPLGMLIQGWNGIMGALGLDSLVVDVDAIFAQVKAILSQPPMETIQAAWTNIKSAFSIDTLEEDFQAVWDSLLGILSWSPMETIEGAWKGVTKFFDDLPQTFKGVVDEVTKLIDLVPDLPDIEVPEWFSLSYLFGEDEEGADSQKPALAKAKLAPALAGAGGTVNNNTQSVQITVNAAEGMNEQDVANQVALLIRQQGGLLGMPSGQGQLYDGA
ncbi:MAG: phage tail tape measure protein, partial [Rhodospirillaceae bacterium]